MNLYSEFKERTTKSLNDLLSEHAFFAFNDQQFDEGLVKLGLTRDDMKEHLCSIGHGGYCLKSKVKLLKEHSKKSNSSIEEEMKNYQFAVDAFSYELGNHEWCITLDPTDAIHAIGFTYDQIAKDAHLTKALEEAISIQRKFAMENVW